MRPEPNRPNRPDRSGREAHPAPGKEKTRTRGSPALNPPPAPRRRAPRPESAAVRFAAFPSQGAWGGRRQIRVADIPSRRRGDGPSTTPGLCQAGRRRRRPVPESREAHRRRRGDDDACLNRERKRFKQASSSQLKPPPPPSPGMTPSVFADGGRAPEPDDRATERTRPREGARSGASSRAPCCGRRASSTTLSLSLSRRRRGREKAPAPREPLARRSRPESESPHQDPLPVQVRRGLTRDRPLIRNHANAMEDRKRSEPSLEPGNLDD